MNSSQSFAFEGTAWRLRTGLSEVPMDRDWGVNTVAWRKRSLKFQEKHNEDNGRIGTHLYTHASTH
jgi:hypothetical protein